MTNRRTAGLVGLLLFVAMAVGQQSVLIPMDLTQTDHLKAYGVVYRALERGQKIEWLLNYRGCIHEALPK